MAKNGANENMDGAFCGTFGTRRANYRSSGANAFQSVLEGFIGADSTQLHHSRLRAMSTPALARAWPASVPFLPAALALAKARSPIKAAHYF